MVWYSAWPLITCPSSWPNTFRTSSSSSSLRVPELITMKGLSMPNAPAFANGVCDTNNSGRSGQSMDVSTSVYSWFRRGNWVGPTRTASAWKISRTPRSPMKP